MARQTIPIEAKTKLLYEIFTDSSITKDDIHKKYVINNSTLDLWKKGVLDGIPEYLNNTFGNMKNTSIQNRRSSVTIEYLTYDCDLAELSEDYSFSQNQIELWGKSVLDNLQDFFTSKRHLFKSPIKSKRPTRYRTVVNLKEVS